MIKPGGKSSDPESFAASKLFQPGALAVSRSKRTVSVFNASGHTGGMNLMEASPFDLAVPLQMVFHKVCFVHVGSVEHSATRLVAKTSPQHATVLSSVYSAAVEILTTAPGL